MRRQSFEPTRRNGVTTGVLNMVRDAGRKMFVTDSVFKGPTQAKEKDRS
jgi:hypothetical protein